MRLVMAECVLGVVLLVCGSVAHAQLNVIPEPQQVTLEQGVFALHPGDRIQAPADARAQWIAHFLGDKIQAQTGVTLKVVAAPAFGNIVLKLDPSVAGSEAYRLQVAPNRVTLSAADNKGLFWGVETLRQLLPLQHETPPTIRAVEITDAPRYAWRGVMLDTARHFYPVSFIEQQIRLMAYYKFNVFHWHLTDDQGWRIQIKRYPKLTRVGAWRIEADGTRYGGFYTQQEIRDVVAYAKERGVMVVPEIEMPGHSSAAIAAYPELACSNQPIQVPTTWGVFRNVDCVGKDSTFQFLENVLDEVIGLFPSPYVHIGGDEVPAGVWNDCKACAKLAKANGIADSEQDLHGYFVHRIQQYLEGRGKHMVGWDEILEGKLDPGALVEVWRGPEEAKRAFANGNHIILAGPFYIDTSANHMTLQDLYRNDPFRQPLYATHPQLVLGGEAPLWSERATPFNGAARLYPRLFAISEHFWNPAADDWKSFLRRARAQEAWLASMHVAYGPEDKGIVDYRLIFNPAYHRWRIRAARGFADLRLHYTLDGSQPTVKSPAFGDVLDLYQPATVTVAPFRGDVQYKASETFRLVKNLALGQPVTYVTPPAAQYSGGALQLVNGILGSTNFHDGNWAAWQNGGMDATLDLGQPTVLHSISVRFMQQAASGIVLPRSVEFATSVDGKTWTPVRELTQTPDPDDSRTFVQNVALQSKTPITARYVRVVAVNYGQSVNGMMPWIFTDEIDVQ